MLLACSCIVIVGIMVWSLSHLAFLCVATDGLLALAIVSAASTCGVWGVPLFVRGRTLALRWQLLIGAGLGMGALSLLMLGLGLAGLLTTQTKVIRSSFTGWR